jgi:hypothetical protein
VPTQRVVHDGLPHLAGSSYLTTTALPRRRANRPLHLHPSSSRQQAITDRVLGLYYLRFSSNPSSAESTDISSVLSLSFSYPNPPGRPVCLFFDIYPPPPPGPARNPPALARTTQQPPSPLPIQPSLPDLKSDAPSRRSLFLPPSRICPSGSLFTADAWRTGSTGAC